jgi:hypothetical protein
MGDPSVSASPMLRPLGFGELFDRAITLYIKNFVPFVGIVAVLLVPGAILQYVLGSGQSQQLIDTWTMIQHPGTHAPVPPEFPYSGAMIGVLLIAGLIAVFAQPFVLNAVAAGVARLYGGERVEFRACYDMSLRRWPAVIGLLLFEFAVIIVAYIALILLVLLAVTLGIGLAAISKPAGVLMAILAVPVFFALVLAGILFVIAFTFAMYAVVFEGKGALSATGAGIIRVCNKHEWWRAVLVAICAGLIVITGSSLIAVLSFAALFFKQIWLYVIFNSIANGVATPFSIVLFAVYYFDVRVRREGLTQITLPNS